MWWPNIENHCITMKQIASLFFSQELWFMYMYVHVSPHIRCKSICIPMIRFPGHETNAEVSHIGKILQKHFVCCANQWINFVSVPQIQDLHTGRKSTRKQLGTQVWILGTMRSHASAAVMELSTSAYLRNANTRWIDTKESSTPLRHWGRKTNNKNHKADLY